VPSFVHFTPAGYEYSATIELPQSFLRRFSGFALPLLLLVVAHFAAPLAAELPASLVGLRTWGPLMVLALTGTLALAFNRGRVVFAVVSLTAAFVAYRLHLHQGLAPFSARGLFAAVCLFVPLNLATLSVLRERGVFTFYGARRLGSIALQVAVAAWVIAAQRTEIIEWIYRPWVEGSPVAGALVPQLALLVLLLGVIVTVGGGVVHRSAIDAGFAGALAAFALACEGIDTPHYFAVYLAASAAILGAAVLQDTFRLAFRDELTGLPSRRALNERMMALGPNYTIAMLDVDHFKRFNDTHGHELGDQVLRMVAAKLERIGGGGRAYRYGGEEFIVLFPGKRLRDAWPQLEGLRNAIARHQVVVRGEDRPEHTPGAVPAAYTRRPYATVSVAVSIGVAERDAGLSTPSEVLRAADKALYRAKEKGRNRLSR
jgi:diguanylate cyclase (GGDEF)-like protein